MIFMRKVLLVCAVCCLAGARNVGASGETNQSPRFAEVLQVIKNNLAGVTEPDLDQAAVRGLLSQFSGQVLLLNAAGEPANTSPVAGLTRTNVFAQNCAYLRVGVVGEGLADKIKTAFTGLQSSNTIKGLVLDLRFAGGVDYAAAAQTADLFLSHEKALLSWNDQTAKSTEKGDPIRVPVVTLVNSQTKGAAEALAAILKNESAGLLIGGTTAGQATVFKDFNLDNGQKLRVATTQIRLGDGQALSLKGIIPDIVVPVDADEEKEYFNDAYLAATNKAMASLKEKPASAASTNWLARRRINEAELVRAQKEGLNPEEDIPASVPKESEPPKLIVKDPALARALDLLKALMVVGRIGRP